MDVFSSINSRIYSKKFLEMINSIVLNSVIDGISKARRYPNFYNEWNIGK